MADPHRGLDAVLLDAGGTLIESHPSPAEVYTRVMAGHGLQVDAADVASTFRSVWSEVTQEHPRGLDRYHRLKGGERAWWGRFVQRVMERLGVEAPWQPILEELFEAFADPSAWQVFPEVREVLGGLRERGLRLAVVSNWDSRLPALLDGLGLDGFFDALLVSAVEGVEKPSPEIFLRAAERLGVPPERCLHAGDSPLDDVRGAESAGIVPVLVDRAWIFEDGYQRVRDLRGLYGFV